ncbi:hypothetical protein F442_10757, partial [Phytophthora nicotianae P10297]
MALEVEVLETINAVRSALSDALNATIEARRVYVADLLVLSNDSLFITKERKAEGQCTAMQVATFGDDCAGQGDGGGRRDANALPSALHGL